MNKLATIIGLLAGSSLLLYWGGEAPGWLLRLECLCVMAFALAFGFSHHNPRLPGWLQEDAVRGVALVYLGVGAMFIDARFLLSAFLIGGGCKLVMKSAVQVTARVIRTPVEHSQTELVIRQEGGISRSAR